MEQISINNIGNKLSGIQTNTGAFGKISATDSFIIWIPETHIFGINPSTGSGSIDPSTGSGSIDPSTGSGSIDHNLP